MKKVLVVLTVVAMLAVAAIAFAGIGATKHDLTSTGGETTRDTTGALTLCGACHVPHNALGGAQNPPLWARKAGGSGAGATYAVTYTVYGAAAAGVAGVTQASTPVSNPPGDRSLTCLSCHDGAFALNTVTTTDYAGTAIFDSTVGNITGNVNATEQLSPAAFTTAYQPIVGPDLRNDHPVGLQYRGTAAGNAPGPGLKDADVGGFTVTTGTNVYFLYGASGDQLECASCHDPHSSVQVKFLRGAKNVICQDCHANK